jgi:CTP-dependent riboflavin kinase
MTDQNQLECEGCNTKPDWISGKLKMKRLTGQVNSNTFGVATINLARVMNLIEARMGLTNLEPGTLNVRIQEEYIVIPNAIITPQEYVYDETIKLQRCLISGYKAIIMRPDTHETRQNWGHGINHLELMSPYHLKDTLSLIAGDEVVVEVEGDDAWWDSGQ